MSRFKPLFVKNAFSMLLVVGTVIFGIFIISQLENKNSNAINIGGSFELIDQNGKVYSSKLVSKKKLIYFGYTFCPDVCPIDILKISNFIDKSSYVTDEYDFIFITVDPDRDNQSEVKSFMSNFNEKLIGLTGNIKDIDPVLSKYRIYVKRKNDTDKTNYLVDHSSLIFLVDESDNYVTHFSPKDFDVKFPKYLN